jgi:exo-poly-alpha-galacturonosidase
MYWSSGANSPAPATRRAFKSQPSRGGVIEDITYRDIQLDNVRQAVRVRSGLAMVPPIAPPAKVLTVVRNVQFINISGNVQSAR